MTDPEEQRLRDAVVDAALADYEFNISDDAENPNGLELDRACIALRDYRAKAAAPRLVPPEEHSDKRWHWLSHDDELVPAEWLMDDYCWSIPGYVPSVMPDDAGRWRYIYHSPALPDTRIPPTDEAIMEFLRLEGWPEPLRNYAATMRRGFAHFTAPARVEPVHIGVLKLMYHTAKSGADIDAWLKDAAAVLADKGPPADAAQTVAPVLPTTATELEKAVIHAALSWSPKSIVITDGSVALSDAVQALWMHLTPDGEHATIRAAAARYKPAQPDSPVQQEITDEEIEAIWAELGVGSLHGFGATIVMMRKFARTLLAKHSSVSIPKTILTQLWNLSKTEDKDQFINDAKAVLKAAGVEVRS